ncbi:AcrR family transcriptional regulator [Saccharothrix coeruleofusca]|uniref:TetR family transcriptional regulator n=1 Tax=Saccharothrix coeruleofusca TaxID=33919 RepID=UPI001AE9C8A0|nr:TetR family transcriptional regulator [Saccharothrix coeruleofusca]MBP2340568.1 AcrR family transcriptional regulator [Saccharothrix coeruleofusca]
MDASRPGLRERTRRVMRAEIGAVAERLFLDQGFDATTMDQVAAEAGISRRTLFRYFDTKEDIVLDGLVERGHVLKEALESRPADEPPWQALRAAFLAQRDDPRNAPESLAKMSKMLETPSLRARMVEKQRQWVALLAPEVQRRLGAPPGPQPDPRAEALVLCALVCLDVAVETWVRAGGEGDVARIYDEVAAAVRG